MSETPALVESFPTDKVQLIKDMCAPDATDTELELFLYQCRRTGLDPLLRQIYFIKRARKEQNEHGDWVTVKVPTIQTSIDGFRVLAERTGKYLGQDGPYWCGSDGAWRDVWLDGVHPPMAARVGIYKQGLTQAVYGVARLTSYAPTNREGKLTGQWAKMPDVMLAKVAESLAFRKAFPQDMSGVYTDAEMDQAPPDPPLDSPTSAPRSLASPKPETLPPDTSPGTDPVKPSQKKTGQQTAPDTRRPTPNKDTATKDFLKMWGEVQSLAGRDMVTRSLEVITRGKKLEQCDGLTIRQAADFMTALLRAKEAGWPDADCEKAFQANYPPHGEVTWQDMDRMITGLMTLGQTPYDVALFPETLPF